MKIALISKLFAENNISNNTHKDIQQWETMLPLELMDKKGKGCYLHPENSDCGQRGCKQQSWKTELLLGTLQRKERGTRKEIAPSASHHSPVFSH